MRAHNRQTLLLVLATLLPAAGAAAAPTSSPTPEAIDTAAPRPLPFSVRLSGSSVRHLDDSYRVLGDDDDEGIATLEVTYELLHLGPGTGLSLGLGILGDERGPPDAFDKVQARLNAVSYYALGSVGFRRQRAFQPFVTLAAGITRADFSIERAPGTRMHGRDHGAFGRASAGFRLAPRWLTYHDRDKRPVFGVHLSFEGGVLLGSRLTFDISADGLGNDGSGVAPIRVDSVSAGDVMPTALFSGLGLGVSF